LQLPLQKQIVLPWFASEEDDHHTAATIN